MATKRYLRYSYRIPLRFVGSNPARCIRPLSRTLNNGLPSFCSSVGRARDSEAPCGVVDEKNEAYARVRVPSGAVLGPGRKIMDPGWGFLIQSFYFIEIIIKLATGLALSCWSENRMTIN